MVSLSLRQYVVVASNIINDLNFLDIYYGRRYNLEKLNKLSPPPTKKNQHQTQVSDSKAFYLLLAAPSVDSAFLNTEAHGPS